MLSHLHKIIFARNVDFPIRLCISCKTKSKSNIFPPKLGDNIAAQIEDDILIHKGHFIEKIIYQYRNLLNEQRNSNETEYYETIKKIQTLKSLLDQINQTLNRLVTKGHIFFREQKL